MAIFFLFAMLLGRCCKSPIPLVALSCMILHVTRCMQTALSLNIRRFCSPSRRCQRFLHSDNPFFLKRFGIKTVMLMSMVAWMLRFGLFAFGDPSAWDLFC
jgi:NHS family xanthosine MFS transporter